MCKENTHSTLFYKFNYNIWNSLALQIVYDPQNCKLYLGFV